MRYVSAAQRLSLPNVEPIPEEDWNLPLALLILSWMLIVTEVFLGYGVASALWCGLILAVGYTALYHFARWIVGRSRD